MLARVTQVPACGESPIVICAIMTGRWPHSDLYQHESYTSVLLT